MSRSKYQQQRQSVEVGSGADSSRITPVVVDGRNGRQWLQAVIGYCKWRAGEDWRQLWDSKQRWADERWYYLNGARACMAVMYLPDVPEAHKGLHLADPVLPSPSVPAPVPAEQFGNYQTYQTHSREWIVDRLMGLRPELTDKKLMLRIPRPKLARLLCEAEAAAGAAAVVRLRA